METLQTLERGLFALEKIAQQHGQITVAQLAEQMNINRTIAYRITRTLAALGYIKSNENQYLELTSKVGDLNYYFEKSLPAASQQILNTLAAKTQSSASLVMAEGGDCVVVKTASISSDYLQINYQLGSRLPIGKAASGIAIASSYPKHPEDPEQVQCARELGYAYSEGILQRGAIGLFVPLAKRHMAVGIVHLGSLDREEALTHIRHAVACLDN